jgi:hypothetical protein
MALVCLLDSSNHPPSHLLLSAHFRVSIDNWLETLMVQYPFWLAHTDGACQLGIMQHLCMRLLLPLVCVVWSLL